MKVFSALFEPNEAHVSAIGSSHTDGKSFMKIACSNGYIQLLEVQMESKKRMDIETFLRGYKPIV
jgi:methionyl-tRNA formyltransferase